MISDLNSPKFGKYKYMCYFYYFTTSQVFLNFESNIAEFIDTH